MQLVGAGRSSQSPPSPCSWSFLDVTIVNVAFPDIGATSRATLADLSWVLNAYTIVFAALLVPAGRMADRAGRKRVFLGGLALFVAASPALRRSRPPSRCWSRRASCRRAARRVPGADLARPAAARVPARAARDAVGVWARDRRRRRGAGPPIGGCWSRRLALGVPRQPAGRAGRAGAGGAHAPGAPRPGPGALPDVLGAVLLAGGDRAARARDRQGPRLGLGQRRECSALVRRRGGAAAGVRRSLRRHPAPVVELADAARALVRGRERSARSSSSPAFSAMLLAGVLFLTGVWHYSVLRAGLSLAPGPLMAALFGAARGRAQRPLRPARRRRARAAPVRARLRRWVRQVGAEPAMRPSCCPDCC